MKRLTAAACAVATGLGGGAAQAAESAAGFYILGQRSSFAAVLPPPGVFFQLDGYWYNGGASGGGDLPFGGEVFADAEATLWLALPTAIWAPEGALLGGRPMVTFTLPFGSKEVGFSAELDKGGNVIAVGGDRRDFLLGDPVATASLGWTRGENWHSTATFGVNIPIGDYEVGRPTNISFNRWAFDLTGAVTWLDAETGWEASGAAGLTFNLENPDTDYDTGMEAHFELAASRTFDFGLTVGLAAYHYQQVTDDEGAPAFLGGFRGRVTGIGPTLAYTVQLGPLPVAIRARWYHEFNAKNRTEGDAAYLGVSLPLAVFGMEAQ